MYIIIPVRQISMVLLYNKILLPQKYPVGGGGGGGGGPRPNVIMTLILKNSLEVSLGVP